jgi:SAM-dependent methyltransferase
MQRFSIKAVARRAARALPRAPVRFVESELTRIARRSAFAIPPTHFIVDPRPRPLDEHWPEPPAVEKSGASGQNIYETGARPPRFDVELLAALNEEYRHRPIVPAPPSYEPKSLAEAARQRLKTAHQTIDLSGKRVLEIGCGNGYEVWYTAHALGSEASGVDVVERHPWSALRGERVQLVCADLASERPFPDQSFDRIISFVVWEHIAHPYAVLEAAFRLLKPGGLAYIRANLYRGPLASHLYRDLFFPWPHLLFSDEVIEEYFVQQGRPPQRPAWVNQLSWSDYECALRRIGFRTRMLKFDVRPIDEELYRRFEDKLGRFPRWDLERDFFTVVLERV